MPILMKSPDYHLRDKPDFNRDYPIVFYQEIVHVKDGIARVQNRAVADGLRGMGWKEITEEELKEELSISQGKEKVVSGEERDVDSKRSEAACKAWKTRKKNLRKRANRGYK